MSRTQMLTPSGSEIYPSEVQPHNVNTAHTPNPPAVRQFNILSLDGGGIRGLSILFILQDLMDRIDHLTKPACPSRPCEHFSLIVGTSTGGLIALMLGRLRMSVNDAIDAYRTLARNVFGKEQPRPWLSFLNPLSSYPRYSADALVQAVRKIAGDKPLADAHSRTCRAAVVAIKEISAADPADLLRTYEMGNGRPRCSVVDAARATTAASTFFAPAVVEVKHGLSVTYIDGGLGHNNPADLCVKEAHDIWGADVALNCIVSIGTGATPNVAFTGHKLSLANKLRDIQTSCRKVDMNMEQRFGGRRGIYFRFDVATNLNTIGLAEWDRLDEVGQVTHAYVQREAVKFDDCAKRIVRPARGG